MNTKDRGKFLREACHHLTELRVEPSISTYEMMLRALDKAEATLKDIGTNDVEICTLILLHARNNFAITQTAVTRDSRLAFMRQFLLNECARLVKKMRTEPTLYRLVLAKRTIKELGAKAEDVGTTNEELMALTRRTYIAEMTEDIRRYGRENDGCALCRIAKYFREQCLVLKKCGLSTEDILGLLQELSLAGDNLRDENCKPSIPFDLPR